MSVIYAVSEGLGELKKVGEGHDAIDMNAIVIKKNILIKDPLLNKYQEKNKMHTKPIVNRIQGYPSPQKLFSMMDAIIYDQHKSDLFSLGVVALQMCYIDTNIREIYTNNGNQF